MPSPAATDSFLYRDVPALGRRVHRLGISTSHGLDEAGIRSAMDQGMNYVFWNPTGRALTRVLRGLSAAQRDQLVIATGPTLGFFRFSIRHRVDKALKLLRADRLDVLQLYWLGKTSAETEGTMGELVRLRDQGKVRKIGVSIHDRVRAGKLAEDSPLDLLMIRYNAAHPGAERDIFPHLEKRKPALIAYTATAWRKLLRRPRGYSGPLPTAGDCYRFCLTHSAVDVVLTGPRNQAELDENLAALARGPLSPEELSELRKFGQRVHG